jgi:hypothetical protein
LTGRVPIATRTLTGNGRGELGQSIEDEARDVSIARQGEARHVDTRDGCPALMRLGQSGRTIHEIDDAADDGSPFMGRVPDPDAVPFDPSGNPGRRTRDQAPVAGCEMNPIVRDEPGEESARRSPFDQGACEARLASARTPTDQNAPFSDQNAGGMDRGRGA